jgi:hypothetical protein
MCKLITYEWKSVNRPLLMKSLYHCNTRRFVAVEALTEHENLAVVSGWHEMCHAKYAHNQSNGIWPGITEKGFVRHILFPLLQLPLCSLSHAKIGWINIESLCNNISSYLSLTNGSIANCSILCIVNDLQILNSTNKCTLLLSCISLLISSYMFCLNNHHQGSNTYISKTYSNKIDLQCLHIS